MRKEQKRNGFTLVEVVVVLVILALLAAIMIPAMTGWIDKAKEKHLIVGCRVCVVAAQTLITEEYGASGTAVTPDAAKVIELADVHGAASNIMIDAAEVSVDMLTYTEGEDSVTYERLPAPHYTCDADATGHATQDGSFNEYVRQWMQNNNRTTLSSSDKSRLFLEYYAAHSAVAMPEAYKQKLLDAGLLSSLRNKDLYWWSYPVTDQNHNLLYTVTFANEYGSDHADWWIGSTGRTNIQKGYVVVVDGKTYVRTGSQDVCPGSAANAYPTKEALIAGMLERGYKLVD